MAVWHSTDQPKTRVDVRFKLTSYSVALIGQDFNWAATTAQPLSIIAASLADLFDPFSRQASYSLIQTCFPGWLTVSRRSIKFTPAIVLFFFFCYTRASDIQLNQKQFKFMNSKSLWLHFFLTLHYRLLAEIKELLLSFGKWQTDVAIEHRGIMV